MFVGEENELDGGMRLSRNYQGSLRESTKIQRRAGTNRPASARWTGNSDIERDVQEGSPPGFARFPLVIGRLLGRHGVGRGRSCPQHGVAGTDEEDRDEKTQGCPDCCCIPGREPRERSDKEVHHARNGHVLAL